MKTKDYVVFLSGKMTGLPDLGRAEFAKYEKIAQDLFPDACILNPCVLPHNLPIGRCLPITLAMLDQSDCVFTIPGWENSVGAKLEHDYAVYNKKTIVYYPA